MAKKIARRGATKKSVKKAATKGAKKSAKKSARKGGRGTAAPKPVKTGRGAGPAEIGPAVVAAFNAGKPDRELWDRHWSPRVVSVEGIGVNLAWQGRKAMEAKAEMWLGEHTIHGASAEGPYLGASGFAVKFRMDVEEKATGKREVMEEIGVYTVENGKIVREEFMYGSRHPVPPIDTRLEPAEQTGTEAVLRV